MKRLKFKMANQLWWAASLLGVALLTILTQNLFRQQQLVDSFLTTKARADEVVARYDSTHYEPLTGLNVVHYSPLLGQETDYQPLLMPLLNETEQQAVATPPLPKVTHIVQKGEILASIALDYGVTTEAILAANKLPATASLNTGQPLIIPENPLSQSIITHRVRPGETLLGIATKYRSSIKDILTVNTQSNLKMLKPGSIITIPTVFGIEPALESVDELRTHTILAGDTPLAIANRYDVSVQVLLAINEIDNPRRLSVGTELLIPPSDGLTLGVPVILHEFGEQDTLIGIVSKYGSSIRDVLYTNPDLTPDNLQQGQLVAIPIIFPPIQPNVPAEPTKPALPPPPPPEFPKLAMAAVEALNVERAAHGLKPLKSDDKLAALAVAHAQDMVLRKFFAHTTPDGVTLRQRLIKGGFPSNYIAGENIQMNSQPEHKTVQVAVEWLMNSPPHRKNILKPSFNHVGVGVVKSRYRYTLVMDFTE